MYYILNLIMKKIFYLKTCSTCKRIIHSLPNIEGFIFQDIKENPITVSQLETLYTLTNSYEALFSKRAKLYKEIKLKNENLTENDYKRYLLEHYTFLKRPVVIINDAIFIGNSKKNINALTTHLENE